MTKIVFTASDTLFGKLIRWFTRSQVSHAFIEFTSNRWGGQWVVESSLTGVRIVPAVRARHNIVCEYECKFDTAEAFKKVGGIVAERYDFAGIFVFVWVKILWRWARYKFKKPLNATKGQVCSEFVTRFLNASPFQDPRFADPELSSPSLIHLVCSENPEQFRIIEA